MAYEPDKLSLVVSAPLNGGNNVWLYTGTDAVGDVDAVDYISDASDKGMKERDFVFVRGADAGAGALMYVSDIDADGNGTLVDITSA